MVRERERESDAVETEPERVRRGWGERLEIEEEPITWAEAERDDDGWR